VILIQFILLSNGFQCSTNALSCSSEGESCTPLAKLAFNGTDPDFLSCIPQGSTCCKIDLHCSLNGTCIQDNIGSFCTSKDQCRGKYLGLSVDCNINQCIYVAEQNDFCGNDESCFGSMKCQNQVCVAQQEGQLCVSSGFPNDPTDCGWNLYCNTSEICTKRPLMGESCTITCARGSSCISNKCVEDYSFQEGSSCPQQSLCDTSTECIASICRNIYQETTSCVNNNQCPNGTSCTCAFGEGVDLCMETDFQSVNFCRKTYKDYQQCTINNNCGEGYQKNTCSFKNCQVEFDAWQQCLSQYFSKSLGKCSFELPSKGLSTWQIALIVLACVIFVGILVTIFLVLWIRKQKKKGYQKISSAKQLLRELDHYGD